jgi:hypothetical protein
VTKSVFAIALLKNPLLFYCFGAQEAQGTVFEYRHIALGFRIIAILEVTKDNDPRFGSMWVAVFVEFDHKNAHRRKCLPYAATASEMKVSFLVNSFKNFQVL